ncbi:hypothetical protein [Desulfocurvus vexinensis]|uniref:hypothetical protein n=1 Tax=Desulfocurvus vexinensis TaxID=399548 RepID=UPI0004917387|nr:hypothetical protein [Desulfocurvus vexinensis]
MRPCPPAPVRAPLLILVLALAAALLLAGCTSTKRFFGTLTEGFGSGEAPPAMGGVAGAERAAWLGPLAPLAEDSDLAEMQEAFDELPSGLSRRWSNFDTQVKWEVVARGAEATAPGKRRTLLARATPEGGAPVEAPLAARFEDEGRWLPDASGPAPGKDADQTPPPGGD